MSIIDSRRDQIYPVLDAAQIDVARRFAAEPPHDFAPGALVFALGERTSSSWLVLRGSIEVTRRDGLDRVASVITEHVGQF